MAPLKRSILEHKEDIWKISEDTRILEIRCKFSMHSAVKLIERCRELEKIVFLGNAFALTSDDVIKYLNQFVFVHIKGEVGAHNIKESVAKEIRRLYSTGSETIPNLSLKFKIPEYLVWYVIHEKAPTYIKRKVK